MPATWGTEFFAPLEPDPDWTEDATTPEYVLTSSSSAAVGATSTLWLSEVGPRRWQALSLRPTRGRRPVESIRDAGLPPRVREATTFPDNRTRAVRRTFETHDGATHVYQNLKLSNSYMAQLEVHLADADPVTANAYADALQARVHDAWYKSSVRKHRGVAGLTVWAGLVLAIAGLFTLTGAAPSTAVALLIAGFVLVGGASIAVLAQTLSAARAGTPFAFRCAALWRNPALLMPEARVFAIPVTMTGFITYAVGSVWYLSLAGYISTALGLVVIYLGTDHTFLRRLFRRRGTSEPIRAPIAPTIWEPVAFETLPPGFPALPQGEILGVAQNQRTKSFAVFIEGNANVQPDWTRWSQTNASWETPRGTAMVASYEMWDNRPETIVEILVPGLTIVIESTVGTAQALENAKILTGSLVPEETTVKQPQPGLFDRVLGYSRMPVIVGFSAASVFAIFLFGRIWVPGPILKLPFLLAVCTVWMPLHCLMLNAIAIVRPRTFRLSHAALKRRAHGTTALMLVPLLACALFAWAVYGDTTSWGSQLWPAALILLGLVIITNFMVRSPDGESRGSGTRGSAGTRRPGR